MFAVDRCCRELNWYVEQKSIILVGVQSVRSFRHKLIFRALSSQDQLENINGDIEHIEVGCVLL